MQTLQVILTGICGECSSLTETLLSDVLCFREALGLSVWLLLANCIIFKKFSLVCGGNWINRFIFFGLWFQKFSSTLFLRKARSKLFQDLSNGMTEEKRLRLITILSYDSMKFWQATSVCGASRL